MIYILKIFQMMTAITNDKSTSSKEEENSTAPAESKEFKGENGTNQITNSASNHNGEPPPISMLVIITTMALVSIIAIVAIVALK